jgi:hypothetical protein
MGSSIAHLGCLLPFIRAMQGNRSKLLAEFVFRLSMPICFPAFYAKVIDMPLPIASHCQFMHTAIRKYQLNAISINTNARLPRAQIASNYGA